MGNILKPQIYLHAIFVGQFLKNGILYFAVIVTKDWGKYDGMLAVLNKQNKVVSLPGGSSPLYQEDKLIAPTYDKQTFMNPHDVCIDNDEKFICPSMEFW